MAVHRVSIVNFDFIPAQLTVAVGDTVTWTNTVSTLHTVTADDNSFNSGNLAQGATFSLALTRSGTVTYHCSFHPTTMKGEVTAA
ncbi:cupredoxin domain-containing protein [Streptomyces sp. AV19]|uniref:plastocyanin/azurin family copper-binding protein n=1 Tax=Streptomyces sp. AV19 TaxID=2793068 RepID=UPI0018FE4518|nr:plastocyanin/azurin family copper-binding protein [Streptomyces sp. AV19]MBH1935174.1 cupredoxin domain-containing protein [Streptomyces sp. AV19]MDG4532002.1 plastocyanin/azurin family copper-binding protein [Streptomyces sp. AV19]